MGDKTDLALVCLVPAHPGTETQPSMLRCFSGLVKPVTETASPPNDYKAGQAEGLKITQSTTLHILPRRRDSRTEEGREGDGLKLVLAPVWASSLRAWQQQGGRVVLVGGTGSTLSSSKLSKDVGKRGREPRAGTVASAVPKLPTILQTIQR